jgi:hypothetical protein
MLKPFILQPIFKHDPEPVPFPSSYHCLSPEDAGHQGVDKVSKRLETTSKIWAPEK